MRRWFERYLRDHGYEYSYKPAFDGVETHVDFLAWRGGVEFVCEVKNFEEPHPIERPLAKVKSLMVPTDEMYGPMRGLVREAALQLEPLGGSPWPLIVVLANPMDFFVPLTIDCLVEAIHNPGGEVTYVPEAPVTEGFEVRNELRSSAPWQSSTSARLRASITTAGTTSGGRIADPSST